MITIEQAQIGQWVRTRVDWPDVPAGTCGLICEDYGSGVTVAWDLDWRPVPRDRSAIEIGKFWAINPACPLRDGFDKLKEFVFLDLVPDTCCSCPAPIGQLAYMQNLGRCYFCLNDKHGGHQ